jgi:hypothetical protein
MNSYQQQQAIAKAKQYQVDLGKDIQIGNLVRVTSGYKSSDGICKVVKVTDNPKHNTLTFEVRRVMKPNDLIVKNSKTTYAVSAQNAEKVDPESLFQKALEHAENIRAHLLTLV